MQETGCPPAASKAKLRFESVDFSDIPGQSRLFFQYQSDPLSLRKYYPSVLKSHTDVASLQQQVLDSYKTDREELCKILEDQNKTFGAGERTHRNINLLRQKDTVAILTGQQTGLFTGPLYTIYKALSAIKMAECLQGRGINAVPIFWAATEDHDFEEIARSFMLGNNAEEVEFELPATGRISGSPVGNTLISEAFDAELERRLDELPATEFSESVRNRLREIWKPGRTIGGAFCSQLQDLFSGYGLIVVDPLDERLKRLSSQMYSEAIDLVDELVPALVERSRELEADGYHAQVLVTPDYFPLFYHTDDGVRRSVRRRNDKFHVTDTDLEFSKDELVRIATDEPERFSPGVMLRPVVQDYLFPTVCYFGGGGEIAYFAQNSEVYRILDRPITPILHRQSFTVIEAKQGRALDKFHLKFKDLFAGFDNLLPDIVERFVNPAAAKRFAEGDQSINVELDKLNHELSRIDPTLAANLATRRRKILYHIGALRKKFHRVQIDRDEIVNRQLRSLFSSLFPAGQLQERRLNIGSFTLRYGPYFIDWVYDSVELEEQGHRLLYL